MAVTCKTRNYLSADKKSTVETIIYTDESKDALAVMQMSVCSDVPAGTLREAAEFLATDGYIVCIPLIRASDETVFVDDTHKLTNVIKNEFPDLPVFIFAYKNAVNAAKTYLKYFASDIKGAALVSAPAFTSVSSRGWAENLPKETSILLASGETDITDPAGIKISVCAQNLKVKGISTCCKVLVRTGRNVIGSGYAVQLYCLLSDWMFRERV